MRAPTPSELATEWRPSGHSETTIPVCAGDRGSLASDERIVDRAFERFSDKPRGTLDGRHGFSAQSKEVGTEIIWEVPSLEHHVKLSSRATLRRGSSRAAQSVSLSPQEASRRRP